MIPDYNKFKNHKIIFPESKINQFKIYNYSCFDDKSKIFIKNILKLGYLLSFKLDNYDFNYIWKNEIMTRLYFFYPNKN